MHFVIGVSWLNISNAFNCLHSHANIRSGHDLMYEDELTKSFKFECNSSPPPFDLSDLRLVTRPIDGNFRLSIGID